MAFVVDIGRPSACIPFSAFVFRSTAGTDTFSLPRSLRPVFLSFSFPRLLEHLERRALRDVEKAVTLRELAHFLSLSFSRDSFIY